MHPERIFITGAMIFNLPLGSAAQQWPNLVHPAAQRFSPVAVFASAQPKVAVPGEEVLRSCCERLEGDKRRIYYMSAHRYRMSLQLKGIYTREGMMFFRLALSNHSHLDYDADSIRFFVMDDRPVKKGLVPIVGIQPVYVHGNTQLIRGKSKEETVIVLPRFTLSEGKHLVIEVLEKNGGRHLQLFPNNYTLLRSRLI